MSISGIQGQPLEITGSMKSQSGNLKPVADDMSVEAEKSMSLSTESHVETDATEDILV